MRRPRGRAGGVLGQGLRRGWLSKLRLRWLRRGGFGGRCNSGLPRLRLRCAGVSRNRWLPRRRKSLGRRLGRGGVPRPEGLRFPSRGWTEGWRLRRGRVAQDVRLRCGSRFPRLWLLQRCGSSRLQLRRGWPGGLKAPLDSWLRRLWLRRVPGGGEDRGRVLGDAGDPGIAAHEAHPLLVGGVLGRGGAAVLADRLEILDVQVVGLAQVLLELRGGGG